MHMDLCNIQVEGNPANGRGIGIRTFQVLPNPNRSVILQYFLQKFSFSVKSAVLFLSTYTFRLFFSNTLNMFFLLEMDEFSNNTHFLQNINPEMNLLFKIAVSSVVVYLLRFLMGLLWVFLWDLIRIFNLLSLYSLVCLLPDFCCWFSKSEHSWVYSFAFCQMLVWTSSVHSVSSNILCSNIFDTFKIFSSVDFVIKRVSTGTQIFQTEHIVNISGEA